MTPRPSASLRLSIGDIPATLATPARDSGSPGVLLLHGTASHRDEVGGMYSRIAGALAEREVGSLRIDFAGCGDSPRPQTAFTVTSQLSDARRAFSWMQSDDRFDPARLGVLGFSQGGMIATLLAGGDGGSDEAGVSALAVWSSGIAKSGAFAGLAPLFAGDEPEVLLDLGFRTFTFSREWWTEAQSMNLVGAIAGYGHPLLAVAGADDDTVPHRASLALIEAAASDDITFQLLPGADHIFNALDAGGGVAERVIDATAEWFASRL